MDHLSKDQLRFWSSYIETLIEKPEGRPVIEAGIAGNDEIADELLALHLSGKKRAGSGLVKDYKLSGEELPKVGNYWIILNSAREAKCIVKTMEVEFHRFDQVPERIAIAEGEGDLSLEHWQQAHVQFFTPFLEDWKISDLNQETVVTEFYKLVYRAKE